MRVGRWTGAACVALALAIVPGALQLVPGTSHVVERPNVVSADGWVDPVTFEALPQPVDATGDDEVAIIPPGELKGPLAEPTAPPARFEPPATPRHDGQVYALIIGIDDYPGRAHDLGAAVADADTVDAALDGFGVPDGNRVVLRDGQARKPGVVSAIRALAQQGGPGSTLVFAYAGHVRKLDADTEALVLADGAELTDVELAGLLAPAVTQRMWLLMATCFAGGFTELLGPGRVLTGAADANSYAYESRRLNASYLVHYLVRRGWLEGQAGPTVRDAYSYANGILTRDHPGREAVQLSLDATQIVLGSGDPSTAADKAPRPAPAPPPADSTPPTTTPPAGPPTTEPPERCLIVLRCRR